MSNWRQKLHENPCHERLAVIAKADEHDDTERVATGRAKGFVVEDEEGQWNCRKQTR